MSMSALRSYEAPTGLFARRRATGLSPEAGSLVRKDLAVRDQFLRSLTLREPVVAALRALETARAAASVENWDGQGATRVNFNSYLHAGAFVRALPRLVPAPDIGVDPDGEVSIEWSLGTRSVLTVSIGSDGRLSYSALIGLSKVRGTEWLVDGVPRPIIDVLGRLLATTHGTRSQP